LGVGLPKDVTRGATTAAKDVMSAPANAPRLMERPQDIRGVAAADVVSAVCSRPDLESSVRCARTLAGHTVSAATSAARSAKDAANITTMRMRRLPWVTSR